ncbi:hypothetical protein [Aurantiacibacter hainanensis]
MAENRDNDVRIIGDDSGGRVAAIAGLKIMAEAIKNPMWMPIEP